MRVVLLWHMHQPEYRIGGRFVRPWVYLHALAGYTDMAVQLESAPRIRAVVNFTPVLLDQLDDYDGRLQRWRQDGRSVGDVLLDALVEMPPTGVARSAVVQLCLSARTGPRAARHPRYRELADAASLHEPGAVPDDLLTDLLVWFHLAWIGESLRSGNPCCTALLQRAGSFGADDRRQLLELITDAISRVVPRWRALAEEKRIELSVSPYYHPLSPLLLDFTSALDCAPGATLPVSPYPGGELRLRWQLSEGHDRFRSLFGLRAMGCWPPEAALSDASLQLLAEAGFEWAASSESVLNATFIHHTTAGHEPYNLFRHQAAGIYCAFRDDGLSDRIGFEYQHWQPADAVRDLVARIEEIAREPGRDLVLIALDGENPWEYYPDGGSHFLGGVYEALCAHPQLRPATMADCVRELHDRATKLPAIRAGSWVHGELLTWVGHTEKNYAWEILIEAKLHYDGLGHADAALQHRLGACEGSDWFWWPGAHNPTPVVTQFDELFRAHLTALYDGLGLPPPVALSRPFAAGVAQAVTAGGTMQPGTRAQP